MDALPDLRASGRVHIQTYPDALERFKIQTLAPLPYRSSFHNSRLSTKCILTVGSIFSNIIASQRIHHERGNIFCIPKWLEERCTMASFNQTQTSFHPIDPWPTRCKIAIVSDNSNQLLDERLILTHDE